MGSKDKPKKNKPGPEKKPMGEAADDSAGERKAAKRVALMRERLASAIKIH